MKRGVRPGHQLWRHSEQGGAAAGCHRCPQTADPVI